jgi:hypothetical protein
VAEGPAGFILIAPKTSSFSAYPSEFCTFLAEYFSTYARSALFMGLRMDFEEVSNFLMVCPYWFRLRRVREGRKSTPGLGLTTACCRSSIPPSKRKKTSGLPASRHRRPAPFPNLPILIFSEDPQHMPADRSRANLFAVFARTWNSLPEELKPLSPRSRRIVARESPHSVQAGPGD